MANAASLISKVPLDILREPFYEGSVQRLYEIPDEPDYMVTETSAGGSVFDVGTIFSIEGSDVARAVFRHVLYSGLAKRETWQEVKAAVESAEGLDNSVRKILLEGTIDKLTERGAITHHCGMVDALSGEVLAGDRGALRGIPTKVVYWFAWQQNHPDSRVWGGGELKDPRAAAK